MPQQAHTFRFSETLTLNYLLYLSDAYLYNCVDRFPLMLFLHGSGERGDDPKLISKYGLPQLLESRSDFPFVVVSPQCPANTRWFDQTEALAALLDDVTTTLLVDRERIYLTGLSMGGQGTWALAAAYPQRFAAIAPICGFIPPGPEYLENICALSHIPTWVFHGAKDDVVPVENSETLAAAMQACGAEVRLTIYPDANHNSWDLAYGESELYTWLLTHRRVKTMA